MNDAKLEIVEAFTNPWWQQFHIKYEEKITVAYYHVANDSFQVICDNPDLTREIVKRLRLLKQELTLADQNPIVEVK